MLHVECETYYRKVINMYINSDLCRMTNFWQSYKIVYIFWGHAFCDFQHKIDISLYVLMDKMTHIYETRHTSYDKSDIFTTHPGNPP